MFLNGWTLRAKNERHHLQIRFLKDWKKLEKKRYKKQELLDVVQILREEYIPAKYHDHALSGNYKGYRECHIRPNWLLVYKSTETEITLIATGTHDDLFK